MFIKDIYDNIININSVQKIFKKKEYYHGKNYDQWRYYICADMVSRNTIRLKEFKSEEELDKYFEKIWELLKTNCSFDVLDY